MTHRSLTSRIKSRLKRMLSGAERSISSTSHFDSRFRGISTESLAREVASRIEAEQVNSLHDIFYAKGFHLLRKHFYLPVPDDTDRLNEFWGTVSELPGVDMNISQSLEVLEGILPAYLPEFRDSFPIERPQKDGTFYLMNGGYMAVDAHVLYCFIRHFKPKRVVEIGNGNSTLLTIAAADRNHIETGQRPKLTSIDPYPWPMFENGHPGLDELLSKRVQDVPTDFFEELESGDILFIDSSHVIRSGNDVHYEFLEILPRLKQGVLVHIHDISLPKPYPKVYFDNQLYWNEQYLLQAFLIGNRNFEVIWAGNHMMMEHPGKMLETFPEIARMREEYPYSEPTAFWMRVREPIQRPTT